MLRLLPALLLIVCTSTSVITHGQTSKLRKEYVAPTNAQRYGNDYEIVDFTLNSQTQAILETLDLASVENLRLDTEDRIVPLPNTTYQVLLYAKDRVRKPYFFIANELDHETK